MVVMALFWSRIQFEPERHVAHGRFTDYRATATSAMNKAGQA